MSRFASLISIVLSTFLLASPSLFSPSAHAQPNGCGSGWNVHLVPNSVPLLNCQFGNSCNSHDVCYSNCEGSTEGECAYMRCRKGGDLFESKSPQCIEDLDLLRLASAARSRRATCDKNFYGSMRLVNTGRSACEALAIVYLKAVKTWGDAAFSGLGNSVYPPTAWKQPQDEYNKAIAEFFEKSTEDEFKFFVETFDSSALTTNFCGQLKYSKERGLVNLDKEDVNACKKR